MQLEFKQADFFLKTQEEYEHHEQNKAKQQLMNLRKGTFARFGELYKLYSELYEGYLQQRKEIEELKYIIDDYVSKEDKKGENDQALS